VRFLRSRGRSVPVVSAASGIMRAVMPSDNDVHPTIEPVLAKPGEETFVERGLPIRQLSMVIEADRRATDPIYSSHRPSYRLPTTITSGEPGSLPDRVGRVDFHGCNPVVEGVESSEESVQVGLGICGHHVCLHIACPVALEGAPL